MTRLSIRMSCAVLVACSVTGALVAARGAQQRPVFRAGANFVTVDAYPRQNGRVVEGLKADDFDVLEDGKPQKIEQFDFVRVEPGAASGDRRDPNTQEEGNQLAADPRNRVFVAYLDLYHVNLDGSQRMRQPLVSFLNRLLAPNDLFGVTTPRQRPSDLVLGRKTLTVEDELTRYWTWGQQAMSMQDTVLEPEEKAIVQCYNMTGGTSANAPLRAFVDRRREDIVLTNLEGLVKYLGVIREARKTVIVFTRGWAIFRPDLGTMNAIRAGHGSAIPSMGMGPDGRLSVDRTNTGEPNRTACDAELARVFNLDDELRFRDIMAAARQGNVTFDLVNPAGLEAADIMGVSTTPTSALNYLRDRAGSMRTLADNTDGVTIIENNDLSAGLRRLADDLSAYYLLGYYSTNSKFDGKFRQIDVKVKTPGVKVSARRGYMSPKETDLNAPAATVAAAAPATGAPMVTDALASLARLRPSSELFTYGVATPSELQTVIEIAGAQIEAGKWTAGGDVVATVTGPNGEAVGTSRGHIEAATRSVLVRTPLPAGGSGPWHISVSLKGGGGGGDSLDERADVKASGGVLLGDAVVFRATPAARSPLRPVADFQFRRTERLHVEWPALKTLDRREARLLDRKGQALPLGATVTEREGTPGQPSVAVDVNLAPLAEGDYVLELVAGSGTETERKLIAFRVVR